MIELWDSFISDGFTLWNILILAGIALVVLISIREIKRIVKKKPGAHFQTAKCSSCGWRGNVSRFAGRCPQCNQPLGDRKAESK